MKHSSHNDSSTRDGSRESQSKTRLSTDNESNNRRILDKRFPACQIPRQGQRLDKKFQILRSHLSSTRRKRPRRPSGQACQYKEARSQQNAKIYKALKWSR